MATLTNTKIKDTYVGLLKTTDNQAIDAAGVTLVEDGAGNASALSVGRSGNGVTITGGLNATLSTAAQPNITSVGTLSSLAVSGNLTVDTNTLYVDAANNRVGIGTSSPAATLDVDGTTPSLRIGNTAGVNGYQLKSNVSSSADFGFVIEDYSGVDLYKIQAGASGSHHFYIDGSEKMRIDSSGNVGIGTSSPTTRLMLEHNNDGAVGGTIRIKDRDSQQDANQLTGAIEFETEDASIPTGGVSTAIKAFVASNTGGSYLTISTTDISTSTLDERMRIDSSGNVGIGGAATNASLGVSRTSGGAKLALQRTNSNTTGSIGQIGFQNLNGEYVSGIVAYGDGDDAGSHLAFHTTSDAVSTDDNVFDLEERMRITSGGDVLIGTTSSSLFASGVKLYDSGTGIFTRDGSNSLILNRLSSTGSIVEIRQASNVVGSISVTASATAYNTSSDYRLKENVVEMTGALDRVDALKPSRFNFIGEDRTVDGFLAHEVQAIVPEAVTGEKDAVDEEGNPIYQGIDHSKIVPILTAAIQELSDKIKELESKLNG